VAMDTLMTGLIMVACSQLAILEHNIILIDNEKSIHRTRNDEGKSLAIEGKALSYQLKRYAIHSNKIFQ